MPPRTTAAASTAVIETHPLTPDRWRDFAALMSSRFDTRHCWCMWPRLATNYHLRSPASNRRSIKKVVDTAQAPPGVLAYVDGEPAGWCAIAPRTEYPKLDRTRVTAAVDDKAVWSVVCFLVLRPMRGRGLSKRLLSAAVELASHHGAKIVEGYPIDDHASNHFHGYASAFKAAGFNEVARHQDNRPIMRRRVAGGRRANSKQHTAKAKR